jgi:hypothetical protein
VGCGVAEEAVETGNGGGGRGGLFRSQGTCGGEDAGIHCPTIVKQIANGYLQFFGLAGSGGGGVVEGGWALRGSGAIGGRDVDGRGGSVGDAGRSEAGEKGGNIAGIGDGESAGRAVVRQRETKER